ncbi:hypothetical protein HPB48_024782 [Haemaphysalis longicornis]|uniref:RRM domain-containing protein n=1 Tax=Haemaphysalis longicornis TaxID=44386 RepID=A0A9J6GYD3_HAELO|nr:hypothetical protein HPB48_024782 [Haemaphysalis longicornis]
MWVEEDGVDGVSLSLSLPTLPRTMNSPVGKDQPDPDAIKMFVGQIPRSWDEGDLKKMFEDFGPVYQINVLRDKATGTSRGRCRRLPFSRERWSNGPRRSK